jgi:LacI family transcriptional regulator
VPETPHVLEEPTCEVIVVQQPPVTMADIAAMVAAPTTDVALAIAADPQVPSELRGRIVDAIDVARYRPLEAIRARLGRAPRVAIVLKVTRHDDPEASRFYAPIAGALARTCVSYGAEVVPATVRVDAYHTLKELPAELVGVHSDIAVLIGSQLDTRAIELIRAALPPVVLIDGYAPGDPFDSVVTDNLSGAHRAIGRLVEAGHREIALFGTEPRCYPSMQDRRTGYIEAMAAAGLPVRHIDTSYIFTDSDAILGVTYLRRHPEVTALFGANDLISIALMRLARDHGLRCPADFSIVGFDDIDLANMVIPGLTTLAVDKQLMGRAGFAVLTHRLEAPESAPLNVVLAPQLVERDTVGPPRSR